MKGLWQLTAAPIGPGLGIAVYNGIIACFVILFTCISIARRSKYWLEAWLLHLGMILLSFWYVLHSIDLGVRQSKAILPYRYILVGCFFNPFRVASDILVLCGTWRVLIRYHDDMVRNAPANSPLPRGVRIGVGVVLYFMGFYHSCLLFALSFAWLSFSDLYVINAIAQARSIIEVMFTALVFICTIGVAYCALDITENHLSRKHPYREHMSTFGAAVALPLLVRSFCEIIVVGQLDRQPDNLQDIVRAREVTYGLFSTIFAALIIAAVPGEAADRRLVQMEQEAVDGVATWLTRQLQLVTRNGTITAPNISTLLETLESTLNKGAHPEPVPVEKVRREEIDRLKAFYANWAPINKYPEDSVGAPRFVQ